MPDDLPIYPDTPLKTGLAFADLARYQNLDQTPIWLASDQAIARMEGADNVAGARQLLLEPSTDTLLRAHSVLFPGAPGAGSLRRNLIAARYRGQDCPEPEHIERSLNNFFKWMDAESMSEIHPIERSAIVLTRVVDIWPFEFGNLTAAIVLANAYLRQAGLPPFFVQAEHMAEFERVVGQAVAIETQPLVQIIHRSLKRELDRIVR